MRRTLLKTFVLLFATLLLASVASATPLKIATGTVDCNGFTINVSGIATAESTPMIALYMELTGAGTSVVADQFAIFPDSNYNFASSFTRKWSDYGISVPAGAFSVWGFAVYFANGNNYYDTVHIEFTPATFTCTEEPPVTLTTFTQGGWGSDPNGNNPGSLLHKNFTTLYPNGVQVGGGYKLTFTTAQAITNFLPQGGKPASLTANATNPLKSAAGVFAGQVLALRLSVDFSNAGITQPGLGSMNIITIPKPGLPSPGALAGYTVADVLDIANKVLGGNTAALPAGMTISQLNDIVDAINKNYDGGVVDNGFLE